MWYRIKQVWWRLLAAMRPVASTDLEEVLTPDLIGLFRRMSHGDQTHSLRVKNQLVEQGHDHPDLLVAALLHDVGKSRYRYTIIDRMFVVIAKRLTPAWYNRRGQGAVRGWGRAILIAVQHPSWSAEDMARAGASPLACELARRHQDAVDEKSGDEIDRLLHLLQQVDDAT